MVRVLQVFLLALETHGNEIRPGRRGNALTFGVDQLESNITAWTLVQHADLRWYHGHAQGPPFFVDNLQDRESGGRKLGGLSRPTCVLVISRYIEAVARDVS